MASSLSAMLASLGRKGEQLVSSATAHISNAAKIAQTAMPDPFHDKASEIDEIREYLGYLSTPQKKFARRNDSTTGLLKERASLTDFLTRAKSILENHRQLFNLDFSKPKNKIHEKPFTDLIAHLEREINHLEAHPEEKTKELFQETLTAVSTALGKLHQLKVTQAGIFTSTARLAEAAPELLQCIAHLNTLKDAILSNNPRKILNAFAPLDLCIDTLLKQKEIVFYGPELTSQHEDVFRELQRIFKAYKALPDSLKQDARFHPNDIELMNLNSK